MSEDNISRLPHPGPRPIGAIVQNVVSAALQARKDRKALIKAHEAAAEFHAALARALEAEEDIDEAQDELTRNRLDQFWIDHLARSRKNFAQELGEAGVALMAMPIAWQAVLHVELPAPPKDAA